MLEAFFVSKLNKYNTAEKCNTAEKYNMAENYNCEWRRNSLRQAARREAEAVICSSNCHLICMLGQKTLHTGIEGVQGKLLKQRGGLWKVRRTGRLLLQHFSHFTDFTLEYTKRCGKAKFGGLCFLTKVHSFWNLGKVFSWHRHILCHHGLPTNS